MVVLAVVDKHQYVVQFDRSIIVEMHILENFAIIGPNRQRLKINVERSIEFCGGTKYADDFFWIDSNCAAVSMFKFGRDQ